MDRFELGMHVGEIKAWCEAAKNEAKRMSLSAPFKPEEYEAISPFMDDYAMRNGIHYYLEKELIETDLFGDMELSGFWVYVIFKHREVLEEYLSLKRDRRSLIKQGKYDGEERKDIAVRFGRLLGYSEENIHERWS